MISIQSMALIALLYLFVLFLIAYIGDSDHYQKRPLISPNVVYALSLAVYCSSWTFYGAVGTATFDGLDYLAIYFGPFIVFLLGYPVIRRIILICKQSNITTISDFISSRYGKSRRIGILVTVIAVLGSLPYIALQLKSVSMTFGVLNDYSLSQLAGASNLSADSIAFYTGLILALFAILFGTRHLDAAEHHRGMVLAIAFESIVKLVAILAVGYYAFYLLIEHSKLGGLSNFVSSGFLGDAFSGTSSKSSWVSFITKTLLSMSAIVLLPRQFQVMVVESLDHRQFKTAMWLMPIYLLLTSIIVIPIALTGLALLPDGQVDLYVLTLPLSAGNEILGIFTFIGGLSAATAMVIVGVISLSTMVSNDLVMPYLLRNQSLNILTSKKLNEIILLIRRLSIVVMMLGAYGYYKLIDSNINLANIGLISFAAIFQFVPAVLCGLFWKNAHSRGIFWGLFAGSLIWLYTLVLPILLGQDTVDSLWGFAGWGNWLHPQSLFGIPMDNSLTHGVVTSLVVNVVFIVYFSLREEQSILEKMQASRFFYIDAPHISPPTNASNEQDILVHPDALRIVAERIIGFTNTDKLFAEYEQRTGHNFSGQTQVDRKLLTLVQMAISGVIGTSSAQKVISETILEGEEYLEEGSAIVDSAYSVLRFNRNLLQTTLQNITHGISVVDKDHNLVIWNDRYLKLFEYPDNLIYIGKPIREVLEYNAQRGDFKDKDPEIEINKRMRYLSRNSGYQYIRMRPNGTVVKSVGEPMPGGGFVTTYEDITENINASEQLRLANEELEDRVRERTRELETLTEELEKNTRSKTHFLAAASHDLLQPINAARLFTHSITEQEEVPNEIARLAGRVDQSLVNANEILRALLDVSKLDAGGIEPEPSEFGLVEFIEDICREFEAIAENKEIALISEVPSIGVKTDRQLLLSVLQNFLTNAVRYTNKGGRVLIAVTQVENEKIAKISVSDTGIGIDPENLDNIFNEFFRVKTGENETRLGLGLGLSIADRISRLLGLKISVDSVLGEGSTFSIDVPMTEQGFTSTTPRELPGSISLDNPLNGIDVLCIDNDPNVLEAMQALIEGWGCVTTCVSSYALGIQALKDKKYQIVLADYRLDFAETGLDFLAYLKDNNTQANAKGILITAEQDITLMELSANLGFQYLAKPIQPAELKTLMRFLLTDS